MDQTVPPIDSNMPRKFFPKLFKTGSKGADQEWEIHVFAYQVHGETRANIVTRYGQVGGKMQHSVVVVEKGKNLGKANATTAYQQAESEAESKWKKQLDKGYEDRSDPTRIVYRPSLPMLAQEYEKHKRKVDFSAAYVQPKLDGVRAIASRHGNVILLHSRQGKEHKGLDHIRHALLKVMRDGDEWDGELYRHGMTFQNLISLVKKPQPESVQLEYHLYDQLSSNLPFGERQASLADDLLGGVVADDFWGSPGSLDSGPSREPNGLVLVATHKVIDHNEVAAYHQLYVERGYEGVMVRWGEEGYRRDYRSPHLLKAKLFKDGEFEIVDVVPGVGKEADKGTFVCKTDDGAIFHCRPRGSDELRASYLSRKGELIGRPLTVRFFEWTTSSPPVPRFPVGVAVRDYEG